MASSQDEARPSSGSYSKAMKLLGLSKLPPDASRSDHLSLIRQHRSVRKERAKSSSPMTLKRGDSASRLGAYNSGPGGASSIASSPDGGGGGGGGGGGTPALMPHYPGEEDWEDDDEEEEEEEGVTPHQQHRHSNSEWLDMRESSLKLTPTDLDERFLQMITDLMKQFPEPPNPDSIMDLSSPATAAFGRRGLHKPGSHRRALGGGGDVVLLSKQNPMYQHQQQMAADSKRGRGVREVESPMRIRYNKAEEQFSL